MPKLIDQIEPYGNGDFSMLDMDAHGKGGWRVVADLTARDNIPNLRRTGGMMVRVKSNGKYYVLGDSLDNSTWTEETFNGTTADPDYFGVTLVRRFVSPSGSDANDGKSAGAPWLTVQKALSDIPNKYSANIAIFLAAGTYTETKLVMNALSLDGKRTVSIYGTMSTASSAVVDAGSSLVAPYRQTWEQTIAPWATAYDDNLDFTYAYSDLITSVSFTGSPMVQGSDHTTGVVRTVGNAQGTKIGRSTALFSALANVANESADVLKFYGCHFAVANESLNTSFAVCSFASSAEVNVTNIQEIPDLVSCKCAPSTITYQSPNALIRSGAELTNVYANQFTVASMGGTWNVVQKGANFVAVDAGVVGLGIDTYNASAIVSLTRGRKITLSESRITGALSLEDGTHLESGANVSLERAGVPVSVMGGSSAIDISTASATNTSVAGDEITVGDAGTFALADLPVVAMFDRSRAS